MSTKTITDYTAATTIDGTNDYLLIEQSSVYKRINRAVLLNIAGNPVGTTDVQSIANKILDNTNSVTVKDTLFFLQDDGDTTKQLQFQLSGITTATTRTLTIPNISDTIATLTATQVFTNKTLTSPVITGGTIDNSTITVDSISGHTSSTVVTVGGVQMSAGVVNTANAVNAVSIAASGVQPQALFAGTGTGWSWQTYTPTFANVTTGNGTVEGKYIQIGKTVFFSARFTFGNTSAFTGVVTATLPVTSVNYTTNYTKIIGNIDVYDLSATAQFAGGIAWKSTTVVEPDVIGTASTYGNYSAITSTTPITWATGDVLDLHGFYEAA